MRGKPATVKSYVASFLSKELFIPHIDKDDIKDVVAHYFTEPVVADEFSYAVLFNIASSFLKTGSAVICDSPLYPDYAYFQAQNVALEHKVPLRIIHVVIGNIEEWKRRLNNRSSENVAFHRYSGWESHEKELMGKEPESIDGEFLIDSSKFGEKEKENLISYILNG